MARSRGLVWAMEELEEQEAAAVVEEPMAVDSMETDMLEVTEQAAQIDETNTAIEEAVEDLDTLEDIASVMDESVENGGMDQVSARVAEVAVESIYARLGVRKSKSLPAMESFGSKGTRLAATKLAVEGIGEGIKYVWEKIKAAAQKVWGWIKTFLGMIVNTAGKLKDRAAELAAKVKGLVGAKKPEGKVDLGSVGAKVAVDGKADTASVMSGLDAAEKLAKGAQANSEAMAKDMTDSQLMEAIKSEDSIDNLKTIHTEIKGFNETKSEEENMTKFESGQLPGGDVISVEVPKEGIAGKEALMAKLKALVTKFNSSKKSKVAKEEYYDDDGELSVPAASPEELGKVCEKVGAMAKIVEAGKSALGKITSMGNSFMALIKSAATKVAGYAKDLGSLIQRAFSTASGVVASFFSKVYTAIVNSGKACLDWVEKHYQAYKGKKAEKAAATAEA